jgi:thiol-disulfide isomerase/thioredoxin
VPAQLKSEPPRVRGKGMRRRELLAKIALLESGVVLLRAGPPPAEGLAAGVKSPPLRVRTIDGQAIEIDRQTGKAVLVDFMTTSCPTCKLACAGIQNLYRELGGKGFLPVALAIDPQAPNVLPLYRNVYGLTFPVAVLPREEALRYLHHPTDKPMLVPTLVLLDKGGRVSMTQVGWSGEQPLRSAVNKVLSGRS